MDARSTDPASFAIDARRVLAAGVRRIEYADGSAVELYAPSADERDTVPLPRGSETRLVVPTRDTDISDMIGVDVLPVAEVVPESEAPPRTDPHPDTMPEEEPTSVRLAREFQWLDERGELLCGGARVLTGDELRMHVDMFRKAR